MSWVMAVLAGALLMTGGIAWDNGKRGVAVVWAFYGLLCLTGTGLVR